MSDGKTGNRSGRQSGLNQPYCPRFYERRQKMTTMINYSVREKFDRRVIDDRRRLQMHEPSVLVEKRRKSKERRSLAERRTGWARITRFTSLYLGGHSF